MYDHLGVFSWTTEFWSPQRQAGLSDYHFTDWISEHPIEDDLKLIEWAKKNYPDAYVDWYEFDHPSSARSSSAGWDIINYWFNVPFDRLEDEVAPHSDWALFHLLDLRRCSRSRSLDVGEARRELVPGAASSCRTPAGCPTNVTDRELWNGSAVRGLEVELELPERRTARRR